MAPKRYGDDEDEAPWLAEAAPAGGRPTTQVSRRSLFWTLVTLLVLAAIAAVGLVMLLSRQDGGSTAGYMNAEQAPLIEAEPGPFKVKPADPQGLEVAGEGDVIYEAGEGIDQGSVIDESARPEEPVGRPRDLLPEGVPETTPEPPRIVLPPPPAPAATRPATTSAPAAGLPQTTPVSPAKPAAIAPARSKPDAPKPQPATPPVKIEPTASRKPGTVQLGAFSSEEKANAAWVQLSGRHGLSGKKIIAVEQGGKTLYRLRAASADTAATCTKLKAAGDACSPVE